MSKIKLNTQYHSTEGIITVLTKYPYENQFGKTFKYMYLNADSTAVDEFTVNSTFAQSLKEVK